SAINTNSDGKVTSVFGIILDITKQWQDEYELIQSKANLQSVLENTDALVYSIDCNYKIIYTNSLVKFGIAKYLGMYDEDIQNFQDFDLKDNKKYWLDNLELALKGSKMQFERSVNDSKGIKYFEVIFNPVFGKGNILGVNIFVNDITR